VVVGRLGPDGWFEFPILNFLSASVVASKWAEPFGRVTLEAHAGGAALISSGTGGLSEISGDAALYLEAVTGPVIASALCQLAGCPPGLPKIG